MTATGTRVRRRGNLASILMLLLAAGAVAVSIAILGVPHTAIVLGVLLGVGLATAAGTELAIRVHGPDGAPERSRASSRS